MLSVPPIFWSELGLVLARPASERPLDDDDEPVDWVPPLLELLELPLDPQAATAIEHAATTKGVSVSRNRRIQLSSSLLLCASS
jgi:hypothetical protein